MKKAWLTTICFLILMFGFFHFNFSLIISLAKEAKSSINLNNAKETLKGFDSKFRERIIGRGKIIDIYGIFNLALNKKMIGNFEYIKDKKNNMQLIQNSSPYYENIKNFVSSLSESISGKNIPLLYFYLPGTADERVLPVLKELYVFNQYDERIAEIIRGLSGINFVDANKFFNENDKIKFKTDLHLTTNAEFRLAQIMAESLHENGVVFDKRDSIFNAMNYNILSYDFIGNLRAAGRYFTRGIDKFESYIPTYNTNLLLYNPSGNILKKGTYEQTVMNGYEHSADISEYTYWITNYMQYPSPYYTIDNFDSNNTTRLLFIMDSLSMRTITFLAPGVEHITVIDPRAQYSDQYLSLALKNNKYDAILIAGSATFLQSARFLNLYEIERFNRTMETSGMWVDYCNGVFLYGKDIPLGINDESLNLSGWAIDVNSLKPLSDLYVSVGNKIVKCNYGNVHEGVSSTFNNPDLTNTGYNVTIPKEILYDVSEIGFIMIGTDGSYRYAPVNYKLNLPKNKAEFIDVRLLQENDSLIAEVKIKNMGDYIWSAGEGFTYIATWGYLVDGVDGSWVGDGGFEDGVEVRPGEEYTFRIKIKNKHSNMIYRFIMVEVKNGKQSFIGNWSDDYRFE